MCVRGPHFGPVVMLEDTGYIAGREIEHKPGSPQLLTGVYRVEPVFSSNSAVMTPASTARRRFSSRTRRRSICSSSVVGAFGTAVPRHPVPSPHPLAYAGARCRSFGDERVPRGVVDWHEQVHGRHVEHVRECQHLLDAD